MCLFFQVQVRVDTTQALPRTVNPMARHTAHHTVHRMVHRTVHRRTTWAGPLRGT